MPVKGRPEPETDALIMELKDRGYSARILSECVFLDKSRSYMATKSIMEGYDELMWIDADMVFDPDYVDILRAHDLPIVCGLYPKKGPRGGIAALLKGDCKKIAFGQSGGLLEIHYAGLGFTYTKREVYDKMKDKFNLPLCENGEDLGDLYPYFYPMIGYENSQYKYMGEDYSFFERARQCGYKIYADTTIRLGHIGKYRYSWEDMAGDRHRSDNFELEFEE